MRLSWLPLGGLAIEQEVAAPFCSSPYRCRPPVEAPSGPAAIPALGRHADPPELEAGR